MSKSFFITTSISYVNGLPHLGHAYEMVLADVVARYEKSLGHPVFLLTGVDEHGQKVQQSAQARGVEPQLFCDEMTARFRGLAESLHMTFDRFGRTTDPLHKTIVRQFLQKIFDQGEIHFQEHEGHYSVRQEQFVTEKDMVDGKWPEIYGEVTVTKEANYFFKLSKYQDWLRQHLLDHPNFIFPAFRRNEVLAALEKPIPDLCISRPKSRLEWGIPLPFNEEYVTYVWFDALVNYVSFAGWGTEDNHWPADMHIIGKDILIPHHAIYWPIMLQALGLPLPRTILVHGFWNNRSAKMSKSLGNVVDPVSYIEKLGTDAFRYFLMREIVMGQDGDFSEEKLFSRYQSDLGNDLGNLVNRTLSMIGRYRGGQVPSYVEDQVTEKENDLRRDSTVAEYRAAMDQRQAHLALQIIWKLVQRANQYVEENAPWKLAKSEADAPRLDVVLAHLAETARRLSVLIEPILPVTSERIQGQMNLARTEYRLADAAFGATLAGHKIGAPEPLFPRLETE